MFRLLLRTTATNLVWATLAVAGWSVASSTTPAVATLDPERSTGDRVPTLVERHGCWTGAAPAGAEPTRAVVSRPGEAARVVPAAVGFRIWLDGAPGVLHAFCP